MTDMLTAIVALTIGALGAVLLLKTLWDERKH